MTGTVVLQKLLTGALASALVDDGYEQVGGFVISAGDAADLTTPEALLHAYGFDQAPQYVDVVRFPMPALATATRPADHGERSWPTYPSGFLRGSSLVPVWWLSRTRYPHGAEYWRIRSDGEQKCLSAYDGVSRGWRGARAWRAPSPMVGPRARWRDQEYVADVVGDGVLLTTLDESGPGALVDAAAAEIRPGVWTGAVPLSECDVFELVVSATVRGERVRVLDSGSWGARVLLETDEEDRAARVGADLVEPGVFEAVVPVSELTDTDGVTHRQPGVGTVSMGR
jgi:hypothetical protein